MAILDASTAHFLFEVGSLSATDLQVADFVGREAISQPFRFDLRLVSTHPDIAFDDVLNKPAVLSIIRGDAEEKFHGIVMDFEAGARLDPQRVSYHAVLVPRFWLLGLTHQSRVFQNKNVKDIATEVFKKAGLPASGVKWSLKKSYPAREYVVQYRESDLNFVSRLLEHEGIFYWFDQTGEEDVMVLSDDPDSFKPITDPDEIVYRPQTGMAGNLQEHIDLFSLRSRIVTGKVLLKDYNYRTPEVNLKGESQLNKDGVGIYYDVWDHFKNADEGNRLARVRNEEIECMRIVGKGSSDCRGFRAGSLFTLSEHFRDDTNKEFLLIEVLHQGSQARAMNLQAAKDDPTYVNEFTCIPATAPYRPPRTTPVPKLPGVLTAKIESSGGPYAHLDDQGRYRVRMPFDVSDAPAAQASRPIRLGAPYAGPGYGFHTPSHAGVEMVIACVDGDPDRPLGVCVAPNPAQMNPSTGGNKAQSVCRTAGGNEINMDDSEGAQMMLINASFDQSVAVANNQTISVGVDRSKTVAANQSESVGANKSINVGGNHTEGISGNMGLTVGGDESESIGGARTIDVGGAHTETIAGDQTVTVGGSQTETIAITSTESIGVAKSVNVGAAYSLAVGAMMSVNVGGPSDEVVGGSKSTNAGGSLSMVAGGAGSFKSGSNIGIEAGGNIGANAGGNASIQGKKIVLDGSSEITLKCGGASISLKSGGDITIKGTKITVQGSGNVVVKGAQIEQN